VSAADQGDVRDEMKGSEPKMDDLIQLFASNLASSLGSGLGWGLGNGIANALVGIVTGLL
jgi:hypothetical protein